MRFDGVDVMWFVSDPGCPGELPTLLVGRTIIDAADVLTHIHVREIFHCLLFPTDIRHSRAQIMLNRIF
jgi:hypothetical protein